MEALDKVLYNVKLKENVKYHMLYTLEDYKNYLESLKEIEIIGVNDGTKDNSQKIIDKYVKKYPEKIKSYIKSKVSLFEEIKSKYSIFSSFIVL